MQDRRYEIAFSLSHSIHIFRKLLVLKVIVRENCLNCCPFNLFPKLALRIDVYLLSFRRKAGAL